MPGKGSGVPVGAPPRCEPESNRTSEPAPFAPDTGAPTINIRRWGSMPGKGSGVPVGAPPTVRTAIKPNLKASPHSHPTRVLLQSISGVEVQYPGKGSGVPVGAPPTVRTAIEPNLRASPHSHPGRVLLQSISGVGVRCPE